MSRSNGFPSSLGAKRQSTGLRQLVICCLISVLVLTLYIREGEAGPLHSVRSAVTSVTAPLRVAGSVIASPLGTVSHAAADASASSETLTELQQQNAKLTAKVAELAEAQKTAERLQGLVDLKSSYNLQSKAARIIGNSGDAWTDTVTIDKGSTSGFAIGMPVCSSGGVIGQIIEVSATTSTVRLLTDEQSGISAMIQSTRAQGMLQGQADGTLRLSYVSADADVAVGDIVITSGLGGAFPKGLPLGTVSSVEKANNAVYYTIVVRALTSVENNEEVLVVTSVSSDQIASSDEVAAANDSPQGAARDAGASDSEDTSDSASQE